MRLQQLIKARRNGNPDFDMLFQENADNVIMSFKHKGFRATKHYFAMLIHNKIICFEREYPCGGYKSLHYAHPTVEMISVHFFWARVKGAQNIKKEMRNMPLLMEEIVVEHI